MESPPVPCPAPLCEPVPHLPPPTLFNKLATMLNNPCCSHTPALAESDADALMDNWKLQSMMSQLGNVDTKPSHAFRLLTAWTEPEGQSPTSPGQMRTSSAELTKTHRQTAGQANDSVAQEVACACSCVHVHSHTILRDPQGQKRRLSSCSPSTLTGRLRCSICRQHVAHRATRVADDIVIIVRVVVVHRLACVALASRVVKLAQGLRGHSSRVPPQGSAWLLCMGVAYRNSIGRLDAKHVPGNLVQEQRTMCRSNSARTTRTGLSCILSLTKNTTTKNMSLRFREK
jgi:hypothetical protein